MEIYTTCWSASVWIGGASGVLVKITKNVLRTVTCDRPVYEEFPIKLLT